MGLCPSLLRRKAVCFVFCRLEECFILKNRVNKYI